MVDSFSVEDMKPTARAVKGQEMSIRRAFDLNDGLIAALSQYGTVQDVKDNHRDVILSNKKLKDLFKYNTIEWRYKDIWTWTVQHWYSGALKRSVQVSLQNITETNRKNIKQKVDKLYG